MNIDVNKPPIGNIYLDDKLSITSKKVPPRIFENPSPRNPVILNDPRDNEQKTPTIVITAPN